MTRGPKRIAILGSTGSIGRSTLEVIAASEGRLQAVAMSANTGTQLLLEQARAFPPPTYSRHGRKRREGPGLVITPP